MSGQMKYGKLNINHSVYTTRLSKKFLATGRYTPAGHGKIYSFIPGTIIEVMIKPGDTVSSGETILVLEAMKMKNRIKSPADGVVKLVNVAEGDTVPNRCLLAEID